MYQRGKNVVSASSVNTTKFTLLGVRLIEQVAEALHHGLTRLGFLDGARLGGGDAQTRHSGHQDAIRRSSRLISRTTGHSMTR